MGLPKTSATQLDLCLTDELTDVTEHSKPISPFLSNHHLISATLKYFSPSLDRNSFYYRAYNKINNIRFTQTLTTPNWNRCLPNNLDNSVQALEENLFIALDIHAPIRSCPLKKPLEPWMTENLRALHKARDRLYRKFRRHKS